MVVDEVLKQSVDEPVVEEGCNGINSDYSRCPSYHFVVVVPGQLPKGHSQDPKVGEAINVLMRIYETFTKCFVR